MYYENLYQIMDRSYKVLDSLKIVNNSTQPASSSIENVQKLIATIKILDNTCLFPMISTIRQDFPNFLSWSQNLYTFPSDDKGHLYRALVKLKDDVSTCKRIIEKLCPPLNKYIINVKFPEDYHLDKLPKFYNSLKKVMLMPMKQFDIDGDIGIHSFENGSKINDFFVNNKEALAFLVAIISAATLGFNKFIDYKIMTLEMEKYTHSSQNVDEIEAKIIKITAEEVYAQECERLKPGSNENEARSTIEKSINSYFYLLNEGATINVYINDEDDIEPSLIESSKVIQKLNLDRQQRISSYVQPLLNMNDNESVDDEEIDDEEINDILPNREE